VGLLGHSVAETEEDILTLLGEAARRLQTEVALFFCPLSEASFYRKALKVGCRTIKVMNHMKNVSKVRVTPNVAIKNKRWEAFSLFSNHSAPCFSQYCWSLAEMEQRQRPRLHLPPNRHLLPLLGQL
jgi:hypothetical protein